MPEPLDLAGTIDALPLSWRQRRLLQLLVAARPSVDVPLDLVLKAVYGFAARNEETRYQQRRKLDQVARRAQEKIDDAKLPLLIEIDATKATLCVTGGTATIATKSCTRLG